MQKYKWTIKNPSGSTLTEKSVCRRFNLRQGISADKIRNQWFKILSDQNEKLVNYGKYNSLDLGTTVSAFLAIGEVYYIIHVGDSRIYRIDNGITILTQDHTFYAREVALGRLTEQELKCHPKRNALLQCVGVNAELNPQFIVGKLDANCVYMLCSDGFRKMISSTEIFESFNVSVLEDEYAMKNQCIYLTELNKARNEQDNISVVLIRTL